MVKETIQNGVSKLKLVHALLITVVGLAFWAGRISMRVDVNTAAIGAMISDIKYIKNYLMGWEPDDAAQTQSKAQSQTQSSS